MVERRSRRRSAKAQGEGRGPEEGRAMPKGSPAQERPPGARAPSQGRGTASKGRGRRPTQKGRKGAPPPGVKKRPAEAVATLPKTQKRPQARAPTAVSAGRERPIAELAKRLRITISPEALELAFLHTSYVNERGDTRGSNERLEFLGDAVIDLAVTHYLYAQYPSADEGRLTKAKSVAVSRPMLAEKAEELGLSPICAWERARRRTTAASGSRTWGTRSKPWSPFSSSSRGSRALPSSSCAPSRRTSSASSRSS